MQLNFHDLLDPAQQDTSPSDEQTRLTLPGLESSAAPGELFRPIHYLGSKLRLAVPICAAIDRVAPAGAPVCDLFAGSGTASYALGRSRPVVAVDIQEYARVLCSAVLDPKIPPAATLSDVLCYATNSAQATSLHDDLSVLVDYEQYCVRRARSGELEPLCEIIEDGSLLAFSEGVSGAHTSGFHRMAADAFSRLKARNLDNHPDTTVTRYFGGIYFSYRQAATLDLIRAAIQNSPREYRNTLLAALLSAASEIANTVGKQFAQPIRPRTKAGAPKPSLTKLVERDRYRDPLAIFHYCVKQYTKLTPMAANHKVIRGDSSGVLAEVGPDVAAVYADPPYTRDHYSRFYHVLETMCLRDNPEISVVRRNGVVRASRGIYRADRYQSSFCIRSRAPDAFAQLFAEVRKHDLPLVLSYSPQEDSDGTHPRVVAQRTIEETARSFFADVQVAPVGAFAHSRLNKTALSLPKRETAEIFFICTP